MAVLSNKSIAMGAGAGTIIAIVVLVLVFALSFTGQEEAGSSIFDPTLAQQTVSEH